MKTIATKVAAIAAAATAAGIPAKLHNHLIHATGGSPRRAKRLLKADPAKAIAMAKAFQAAVESGVPFRTALANAQAAWQMPHGATEAPEGGEGEHEDEPAAEPAPVRRVRRSPRLSAMAAQVATL